MAKGLSGASTLVKIGIVLTALGLLFHIIGMATPYWTKYMTHHAGLWRACAGDLCGSYILIPSKFYMYFLVVFI